jgi:hypothetical protein
MRLASWEFFQHPFLLALGLLVTVGAGVVLDGLINRIVAAFRRETPPGVPPEAWDELLNWPETYGGAVHWLGLIERLFFLLVGTGVWPLVAAWLLFKLGCYWGIWQNIARVRDLAPEMKTVDFLVAQSRRANVLTMTCLFGTLGNIFAATLGTLAMALTGSLLRP